MAGGHAHVLPYWRQVFTAHIPRTSCEKRMSAVSTNPYWNTPASVKIRSSSLNFNASHAPPVQAAFCGFGIFRTGAIRLQKRAASPEKPLHQPV